MTAPAQQTGTVADAQAAQRRAEHEVARLEAEHRRLPGQYNDAVGRADAAAMASTRRAQADVAEQLGAARVLAARAAVGVAEAELADFEADPTFRNAETGLAAARAEVLRIQAELEVAQSHLSDLTTTVAFWPDHLRRKRQAVAAAQHELRRVIAAQSL